MMQGIDLEPDKMTSKRMKESEVNTRKKRKNSAHASITRSRTLFFSTLLNRLVFLLAAILILGCGGSDPDQGADSLAVLIDSTGVYTRPISTDSQLAQQFFDQGLRLTWGYHLPEAMASHQEALRHDPDHPMIYWGLALASGPNPNSRLR